MRGQLGARCGRQTRYIENKPLRVWTRMEDKTLLLNRVKSTFNQEVLSS